jgi:YVTN family beta-propeller protein
MKSLKFMLILFLGSSLVLTQAQTSSRFKIVNKIHIPGDGGWDYLYSDDAASRLYVSHGTAVHVVDETNGQVVGTITGMKGVHGIAIATEFGKGYISSGKDTTVTVFDIKTLKVITKITPSGLNPDAILFDPFSKKIFTCNGKSNNSTVIDPATDKIVATIPVDGKPEGLVSDVKGHIYMNFEEENKVCRINSSTFKVENVWPLAPGEGPTGIALDVETHRLVSVCANKIMIILDSDNGKIITTLPIGEKVDGAAFDPEFKYFYSSGGFGTLTMVKEENKDLFKVVENFQTQRGAKTIALNKKTHHIYMPGAEYEAAKDGEKPKVVLGSFVALDVEVLK